MELAPFQSGIEAWETHNSTFVKGVNGKRNRTDFLDADGLGYHGPRFDTHGRWAKTGGEILRLATQHNVQLDSVDNQATLPTNRENDIWREEKTEEEKTSMNNKKLRGKPRSCFNA